jgi:hypothetical protein
MDEQGRETRRVCAQTLDFGLRCPLHSLRYLLLKSFFTEANGGNRAQLPSSDLRPLTSAFILDGAQMSFDPTNQQQTGGGPDDHEQECAQGDMTKESRGRAVVVTF